MVEFKMAVTAAKASGHKFPQILMDLCFTTDTNIQNLIVNDDEKASVVSDMKLTGSILEFKATYKKDGKDKDGFSATKTYAKPIKIIVTFATT